MAKDPASTRIPRLDGVSRIPQPGTVRTELIALRPTRNPRPSSAFLAPRTGAFTGLRPPSSLSTNLKKSSSGDRINSAVNMVSKKTTSAFKKLFSKPEKSATPSQRTAAIRKAPPDPSPASSSSERHHTPTSDDTKTVVSTPRPFTRSETFIRDPEDQLDMLGVTHDVIAQSTPMIQSKAAVNENTHLLQTNAKPQLYSTYAVENAPSPVSHLGDTVTLGPLKNLQRTQILDSTRTVAAGFVRTINFESPQAREAQLSGDATMTLSDSNAKKPSTPRLGETVSLDPRPGSDTFVAENELRTDNQFLTKQSTSDLTLAVMKDAPSIHDPCKAIKISTEDLKMIQDISMPPECDVDLTLKASATPDYRKLSEHLEDTLMALTPDRASMNLPLNSTMNTDRLLDLTVVTPRQMQQLNLTRDYIDSPTMGANARNTTQLLYMTQVSADKSTPDHAKSDHEHTPKLLPHLLLKGAQSELFLPTRTPEDELMSEPMEVDTTLTSAGARAEEFYRKQQQHHQQQQQQLSSAAAVSLQELNSASSGKPKSRFSFGLDLTDCTLDCSIELCDISLSSTILSQPATMNSMVCNSVTQSPTSQQQQQLMLKKQNSFEMDESLGILTPDQMKEFMDSTTNTNNLELPLNEGSSNNHHQKMSFHAMRFDQTPSPEDLPLDPVEVRTDIADMVMAQQQQQLAAFTAVNATQQQQRQQLQHQAQHLQSSSVSTEPISTSTCDTELSKADPMTKSSTSKISNSFITSVTSVTSLDTGYQGDGEMSRPASRGAGDHSPSNGPTQRKGGHVSRQPSFNQQQQPQQPPIRRQDPMTDSDFFTESDADDVHHRGDRRAQVIDGQLYGPMQLQPSSASVFISEDPQMEMEEDSCMESSGIFTDVENRCEDDLALLRRQDTQDVDMSPDGDSTDTVKSNRGGCAKRQHENESDDGIQGQGQHIQQPQQQQQLNPHQLQHHQLSDSQTSSTIHSSFSNDRLSMTTEATGTILSNRTSYCSVEDGGSGAHVDHKSFGSLEEAFAPGGGEAPKSFGTGKSPTSGAHGANGAPISAVSRVSSTRKHSSLTSLCTNTGVHVNSSSTTTTTKTVRSAATRQASSSQSSPKVSPAKANETRAKASPPRGFKTSPASPRTAAGSSVSPTSSCGSTPNLRKAPVPNKWEAVMNKIASNKLLIKKNYNDVKSKVSTGVGGGAGRGGTLTPPVRPSGPSVYVAPFGSGGGRSGGRSGGVSKVLNSKSASVSPTDTGSAVQGKPRLLQGVANRGRSYSKDSEKSSQSDLSLSSGSPKLLAKTTLRAAKKRDVRNLSISPTDLGPPPKTQQTANGASTRPKPANATLKQKRPLQTLSPATSNPGSNIGTGASTPAASSSLKSLSSKKFTLLGSRRLEVKATPPAPPPIKAPLKDHNRIITPPVQQQQQLQSITPTATPTSNKNGVALFNGSNNSSSSVGGGGGGGGSKPQTPTTENQNHQNSNGLTLQQQRHERNNNNHHSSNNSNNNNNNSNNVSPKTTTTTTARSNSQNSSPVLSQYYGNRRSNNDGTVPPTTTGAATKTVDEKASTKLLLSSNSNSNSRKQIQAQHRSLEEEGATSDESHPCNELQQLKHLNRHSCNGRLDYQSLEQHLQQTAEAQQQQNKGIEAMGALMQYLVFDLDAFACSGIKAERTKLQERLTRTLQQLDEAKSVCSELQDTLCDKEAYYTQREEELQDLHRCELEKVQRNVSEMQLRASEQISALKIELHVKEAEQKRSLDCYRLEMENKLALKHQQLLAIQQSEKALLERIAELEKNGLNLRMELKSAEESSAQRLQATTKRERDLLEKLRVLNKELDILRESKASNERDLKDKLNLSQEEVSVLRTSSRRSLNSESLSGSSPRNSSSASIAAAMEITRLQSEAESLRCVLELKQKEISKLTKHNEELLRDADERASLQAKISLLEARNEMLQSELEIKSEKEKDFQRQMDEIQKAFNHETVKRTRLSYDNEALQWQLKQRSEQLHIVEAKLQELSSQDLQTSYNSSLGSLNRSHNGASLLNVHADDEVSPPVSPIIKAVIEKTDSVSWVLEMDDDTPEAAASKMVKRAGSFRSFERSPSTRRHLSVSANAATSAANTSGQGPGPNPLSQSMSAASVIRQHSNEAVDCLGRSNSRMRSKSVSVKSAEPTPSKSNKKVLRQSSTGSNRKNELVPPVWKEPMNTSSPYTVSRPRSSTLKCAEQEEAFYRSSARKLITCDTSALNSGERLELRGLPTHPSVQDLKAPKKSQQIQESAGEAMVSGTNSEDEGCSHSSDEVASSTTSISSAASATSGSSLSLHHIKSHQHMSLEEEVLLLDKINSLNGTPMEVSWSDEADAFPTNTTTV